MIALLQCVCSARVDIAGDTLAAIERGILVFVGADMRVTLLNDGPGTFWLTA